MSTIAAREAEENLTDVAAPAGGHGENFPSLSSLLRGEPTREIDPDVDYQDVLRVAMAALIENLENAN